jgi:hypothetical protein
MNKFSYTIIFLIISNINNKAHASDWRVFQARGDHYLDRSFLNTQKANTFLHKSFEDHKYAPSLDEQKQLFDETTISVSNHILIKNWYLYATAARHHYNYDYRNFAKKILQRIETISIRNLKKTDTKVLSYIQLGLAKIYSREGQSREIIEEKVISSYKLFPQNISSLLWAADFKYRNYKILINLKSKKNTSDAKLNLAESNQLYLKAETAVSEELDKRQEERLYREEHIYHDFKVEIFRGLARTLQAEDLDPEAQIALEEQRKDYLIEAKKYTSKLTPELTASILVSLVRNEFALIHLKEESMDSVREIEEYIQEADRVIPVIIDNSKKYSLSASIHYLKYELIELKNKIDDSLLEEKIRLLEAALRLAELAKNTKLKIKIESSLEKEKILDKFHPKLPCSKAFTKKKLPPYKTLTTVALKTAASKDQSKLTVLSKSNAKETVEKIESRRLFAKPKEPLLSGKDFFKKMKRKGG